MKRLLVFTAATALAILAAGAAPAMGDPFYCDRVGPTVEQSDGGLVDSLVSLVTVDDAQACGQTGFCQLVDLGGGWWAYVCSPPPGGCTRPTGCG